MKIQNSLLLVSQFHPIPDDCKEYIQEMAEQINNKHPDINETGLAALIIAASCPVEYIETTAKVIREIHPKHFNEEIS